MTENIPDLIAEARKAVLTMDYARAFQGGLVGRLASALEKVTAERDALGRSITEQNDTIAKLEHHWAALAAVVEQAKRDVRSTTDPAANIRRLWKARDTLSTAPSVALDHVKAEARESVVTPEAREHWEWAQKSRQANGYQGCVCALCGVMERVHEKGECND